MREVIIVKKKPISETNTITEEIINEEISYDNENMKKVLISYLYIHSSVLPILLEHNNILQIHERVHRKYGSVNNEKT